MCQPGRDSESIAEAALQLSGDERNAYLDKVCAENMSLRQDVEAILRSREAPTRTKTILVRPMKGTFTGEEQPGAMFGPYKLLEEIGEGGMGSVWMAEQVEPVRRHVALKVIRSGMDSRRILSRFEAEQQALALMDHPNIAKVLDAGATPMGRPYFVMELVQGTPITAFCDEQQLTIAERLELFIQVCRGIQHAHQKGIIHRDIKPSNVLVALYDGRPVPKVIDFGVAKATGQTLTERTLLTELGAVIGTPAYMSPEQADLNQVDIDTRSDIYSLGVLLYELLTGSTPLPRETLHKAAFDEILRLIREEEPPRPSTRLSQTKDRLPSISTQRKLEPSQLGRMIQGDLDHIVMKALEKERNRRYETANGFVMDIQRFLHNEPILARAPGNWYRFRKLVQRHRLVFGAAGLVATALISGLIVSTWALARESQARGEADKARRDTAQQRDLALQRLYDSLVNEAHATRLARRPGYRDQAWSILAQAFSVPVPEKKISLLRREAIACLGDFAGFAPRVLTNFPSSATIRSSILDPLGSHAAFLLSDGTIHLRDVASGDAAELKGESPAQSFCFDASGRLISLHAQGENSVPVLYRWAQRANHWENTDRTECPGGLGCLNVGRVLFKNVAETSCEIRTAWDDTPVRRLPPAVGLRPHVLDLTRDGKFLAAGSGDSVRLWNLETQKSVGVISPGLGPVIHGRFSLGGNQFACVAEGGGAVYSMPNLEHLTTFRDYFGANSRVALARAGTVLALPLYQQNRVRLWDCRKNEDLAFLDVRGGVLRCTVSLDGSILLACGPHDASVFRLDSGSEKLDLIGHAGSTTCVSFSPDGSHLASVGRDSTLRIWDCTISQTDTETAPLPDYGESVSYSPDGRYLVTTAFRGSGSAWIWDSHTRKRLLELQVNPGGTVWSAQFTPDNLRVITASTGGNSPGIAVWELEAAGTNIEATLAARRLSATSGNPWCLALASKGACAAVLLFTRGLYFWNLNEEIPPRLITTNVLEGPQGLAVSPDGRKLFLLNKQREVVALDARTGNELSKFPTLNETDSPTDAAATETMLCLSPDGSKLALSTPSRLGIDVWDVQNGSLLYALPEGSSTIYWLSWNQDNQRLAVAKADGDIAVWNIAEIQKSLARLEAGNPTRPQEPRPVPLVKPSPASTTLPAASSPQERNATGINTSLNLYIENANSTNGLLVLNGGDSRQPTSPFLFDWGDNSTNRGFFPQSHSYANVLSNYWIKVTAFYDDAGSGSARVQVLWDKPSP